MIEKKTEILRANVTEILAETRSPTLLAIYFIMAVRL